MSDPTTPKYDLFLSFRGEDTRDNFTSHLYAELRRQNIETFIDYRLERGDEINSSLVEAIEESLIYVVILSEHYASSSWCLDELTEILKCKERYGREVIPVFYRVEASNVRHQRQSYADDLAKHHQRFGGKVDAWKAALTQVAGLSGWDSQVTRPESTLVTEIVKDIVKKLNRRVSSDYEGMTGIGNHIEKIQSLLLLGSPTVRIIGIWGMGGIGKTTIAGAIFEKPAAHFSARSIIQNVQQEIERAGLSHVKKEYLSKLLGEDNKSSEYNISIDPRLKRMKVLLVFDDVKDSDQLKDLIGTHRNFGQGSSIIVTSRDRQVLENANAHEIYQVREMDYKDSLELFCSFAFKQKQPIESYVCLTEKFLKYADGLPLALKVLGSLLYGKTKEVWESQLQKLEKLPDQDILKSLKLSYDGLDKEQKDIFLDIACFHIGKFGKNVEQMLDGCGYSAARIGMEVLKDRCLIFISDGDIWMHDLLKEMGQAIVLLEDDPRKRSRLWKTNDIYDVLSKKKGKGTDAIKGIYLNMKEIKKIQLDADTFNEMHNLRMIKFSHSGSNKSNVTCSDHLKFPNNLKLLHWYGLPQRSLPQNFCPENLISLRMHNSHLEQLWEGDQVLPNLKRLDLSYSRKLIALPDLSFSPNIEEVILSGCLSLTQVNSSSFLNKLNLLCLRGCTELKSINIPSNILSRSSGSVSLRDCHNLETLLISSRIDHAVQSDEFFCGYSKFKEMQTLCHEMGIEIELNDEGDYEIWKSFSDTLSRKRINEFCWLDVSKCGSLTCLPAELLNSKLLTGLSLSGCYKLEELPEIMEIMENLKVFNLDETLIKELPSSLHHLVTLQKLSLRNCTKLKTIPSFIGNLSELLELDLIGCASLETFPSSLFKLKLTKLNLKGCSMLGTFPEILEPAESFTRINLSGTAIKELPSSLHHLVGLEKLSLRSCTKLKTIPSSIGNLSKLLNLNLAYCDSLETFSSNIFKLKLTKLNLEGCSMLGTFPEIPNDIGRLSSLTELSLKGSSIVNLPESLAHLSTLKSLNLSYCKLLECVPNNIGHLSSLTELSLRGSSIVNLPDSMARLSSLRSLNLSDCELLECVPKLPPNLNQVLAYDCPSIKRMMLSSRSDSEEGTFKFYLTNSQELDATCLSNIEDEAYIKINDDAYRSVIFCFPGSAVPDWFSYRCQGHSITIRNDHLNLYRRNKFIGFALCVVFGHDFPYKSTWFDPLFTYELKFESDGQTHFHPNNKLELEYGTQGCYRKFCQHHTILWKYELDLPRIDVETITFEIVDDDDGGGDSINEEPSTKVKECGICPLYSKENDDDDGGDSINEEPSRDAVCLLDLFPSGDAVLYSVDPSSSDNYRQDKRRKK